MELPQNRQHHNIPAIFAEEKASDHGFLRVSAPMVRYSKLEFRKLLRKHCVRLTFSPMIIADSFNNSEKARLNEFTTTADDSPIIAQFAAQNAAEFVTAAQLIYPYVDGVDLNCGCPQTWAIAKGYGCGLLRHPELVRDIMQTVRRTLPSNFSISLKIRLLSGGSESVRSTVELARQMEKCGASFISLHGRNMWQRTSDPLNIPAMAEVKQSLQIPLIVNGNVRSWSDACDLYEQTKADGVMAARGLLSNPTLFNPHFKEVANTPLECVSQWLDIASRAGDNIHFQCFHHHLTFMLSSHMKRKLRLEFNNFTKKQQIFDFFEERFGLRPSPAALVDPYEYTKCTYTHFTPPPVTKVQHPDHQQEETWNGNANGKFFNAFNEEIGNEKVVGNDDFDLTGSFFTELE